MMFDRSRRRKNGVIGDRNALLWHISETSGISGRDDGHPVVMGRKTWESLGRPLPTGRTSSSRVRISRFPAARWHSLEEAVALFPADEEVFVIGGAQIYAAALPLARKFYLTRVFRAYEGDTRFPAWDEREWRLVSSESFSGGERLPLAFRVRVPPNGAKLRIYTTARPPRIALQPFASAKVFFGILGMGKYFDMPRRTYPDKEWSSLMHEPVGLHGRLPGGRVLQLRPPSDRSIVQTRDDEAIDGF